MAKKSKKFRIATEGDTVDGRVIERSWITQMAANYDPAKYRAGINIEHLRSTSPDGPFKNQGFVDALETEDNAEGKAELFGTLSPTPGLIALTAAWQKVFTSIEVDPDFAKSGEAYLVGLAVTDTPASLGTEMLAFTANSPTGSPLTTRKQKPANHFSAAVEAKIEFVEEKPETVSVVEKLRKRFGKKETSDDARYTDLSQAIEELAEHGDAQSTASAQALRTVEEKLSVATKTIESLTSRLDAIDEHFNATPADKSTRPLSTGAEQLTEY